jgi:hypothetical protein
MHNDSRETLAVIAFTKIIKSQKNKNIFCASGCKMMQKKIMQLHFNAAVCK